MVHIETQTKLRTRPMQSPLSYYQTTAHEASSGGPGASYTGGLGASYTGGPGATRLCVHACTIEIAVVNQTTRVGLKTRASLKFLTCAITRLPLLAGVYYLG